MTLPAQVAQQNDDPVTETLYQQVQHFYARQMQLLDEGQIAAWADTFTVDGVFAADAQPEPVAGRAAIRTAAQAARDALDAKAIRRRHWLGMVDVRPDGPDQVRVVSYALVLEIPRGGPATVHVHTTCDDVLVRRGGAWRVKHRQVRRDDLAGGAAR
ncbi:nuclear transport factor 2 family protein [Micromonospora sp. NPDC048830]|uniref:nuclear transport factor 2 family protein n=1 Tax=Micromonospora sp. NPDC048830 TaxID=3364257 RepID=UPI003714A3CF